MYILISLVFQRINYRLIFYLFGATAPLWAKELFIHAVSRSHTTTHHGRQESSGRVISPSQRPLPDNTQHSQQTNINAPDGIGTHNFSKRAAADPRLRPRGHRLQLDRKVKLYNASLFTDRISRLIIVTFCNFIIKKKVLCSNHI